MNLKRLFKGILLLAVIGAVAYLATVGCCHLMGWGKRSLSLTAGLGLAAEQRTAVAALEKDFLARKQASCEILCAKRAQMIRQLRQEQPDRQVLIRLVDEIGTEQTALERATVDHLLQVTQKLDPAQRRIWIDRVTEQLRVACEATACSVAGRCAVSEASSDR